MHFCRCCRCFYYFSVRASLGRKGRKGGMGKKKRNAGQWRTPPRNRVKLQSLWCFESDNEWGIPVVPPVPLSAVPARLVPYRSQVQCEAEREQWAIHFFLDDYRFESVWSYPERALQVLSGWKVVLSPDFSLYRNYPLALQLESVYRNRWCQAYWSHHGFTVIPTVSWSTSASYAFAFMGLPKRSVVAIGTVGIRWQEEYECSLFTRGWEEMVERLDPSFVVVYGDLPKELQAQVQVECHPGYWEGIRSLRRQDGR